MTLSSRSAAAPRALLPTLLALSLAGLAPRAASAADVTFGGLIGAGVFHVNRPADPPGATTFLFGSSFSGAGLMLGGTVAVGISGPFGMGFELLYSHSSTSGFASADNLRREVTLSRNDILIGVVPRLLWDVGPVGVEVGAGVELALGFGAAVEEELLGLPPDEQPLEADAGTWLYLLLQAGVVFEVGDFELPLLIRMGFNPAYPDTTAERFPDFDGADDPGPFDVASDWYVTGLLGVRTSL